jgi:sugar lactone lactonase YvrE
MTKALTPQVNPGPACASSSRSGQHATEHGVGQESSAPMNSTAAEHHAPRHPKPRHARRTAGLLLGAALAALALSSVAQAATQTQTFNFNNTTQYFTVPARVTQLSLVATGGGGGVGAFNPFVLGAAAPAGGVGAEISETVTVTPGDLLVIMLGGGGTTGISDTAAGGPGGLSSGAGLNGGYGGNSLTTNPNGGAGGGGGGGTALVDATSGSLLLVAGGGGGGGGEASGGRDTSEEGGGNGGNAGPPPPSGGVVTIHGGLLAIAGAAAAIASGSGTSGSDALTNGSGEFSGAGGGGGAGYDPTTAGQNAGTGGGPGFGGNEFGGGGGGAGASYASSPNAQFTAGPSTLTSLNGINGSVTVSWSAPVSLAVDTASLKLGTNGFSYSASLSASGGKPPYTWSLASGRLPAGLSLSPSSGVISGTPQAAGSSMFTVKATDSTSGTPDTATKPLTMQVNPGPTPGAYVVTGNQVRAFALGESGNVAPVVTIAGSKTGLTTPDGLAFDGNGFLYVANAQLSTVTAYAPGASGDVAPVGTVAGSATGLSHPAGLALDAAGNLYVADRPTNTITVYAVHGGAGGAPSLGNLTPARTITGTDTGLSSPTALAIDSAGHLWVANAGNSTLTEYPAGAGGNATPLATVAGASTFLKFPQALTIDSSGHLIAANTFGESVTQYPPGSTGNAFPSAQTTGPATQLDFPDGLDVDSSNRLYVANQFGGPTQTGSLTVYAAGANGNATPLAVITGSNTGLSAPGAVAVAPPMKALRSPLPAAALDRRYSARVFEVLGKPPLRWRLIRGHLPIGLRLTRDGRIIGTPGRAGSYRFTVRVTDSSEPAQKSTARITLIVIVPPTITTVTPAHGSRHGGVRLTITGTGFAAGANHTVFMFGDVPARAVRCQSSRRCTVRTLPHRAGTVAVTAIVRGVSSPHAAADRFRYTRES